MMLVQKDDILLVKADILLLEKHISKFKNDIIKWMFIFWIGQVVATFGFILLFLKK